MMYEILNGFIPNIMSEICMVNNELHDHFTRVSLIFYILEKAAIMYLLKASIT